MKTSVIGYPRIGTLRELKFASEKYFRKEITSVELLDTAKSCVKFIGIHRKIPVLNLFQAMIFLFMI